MQAARAPASKAPRSMERRSRSRTAGYEYHSHKLMRHMRLRCYLGLPVSAGTGPRVVTCRAISLKDFLTRETLDVIVFKRNRRRAGQRVAWQVRRTANAADSSGRLRRCHMARSKVLGSIDTHEARILACIRVPLARTESVVQRFRSTRVVGQWSRRFP